MEPFLDFNFRYQTGLVLSVSLRQFTPGKEPISYLRVIPQGASPVIFRASLELPSVPPDMSGTIDLKDLRKIQFTMSGAFNVGEVRYSVELLLLNRQGRSCYKRWNLKQFLSEELARQSTLLVTMGCGDACPFVRGLQKLDWPLQDPKGQAIEVVRNIRDEIRGLVGKLVEERNWL
jgi:hypothetical protein